MQQWIRSGVFRKTLLFILVVSLVPLGVLGWLTLSSTSEAGTDAVARSSEALDAKSAEALELRAVETASAIADFLYEREADLRAVALLPRSPNAYFAFYQDHQQELWFLEDGREMRQSVPLYRDMAYIDATGDQVIRIADGDIVGPESLINASDPANTLFKSEIYFAEASQLLPGEVYVSHVAGFYVDKAAFEAGERFSGVLRFAMPVFDEEKRFDGVVTLALDSRHLEEFTAHIVPTEERFAVASDPSTGNYAYIIDAQGLPIAHPLDHHQRGLDGDGQLMPCAQRLEDFGARPLCLDQLGFADENLPYTNDLARRGEAGSVRYQWEGHDKFVAYAPIPYYSGAYAVPGGIGWVGIGADVATFHRATSLVGDAIQGKVHTLTRGAFVILVLTGLTVLFTAGVLARSVSVPIRQLTEAARVAGQGDLESARQTALQVGAKDELGTLADGFNRMAARLQETLVGLEQELAERKRAEEALRESEERHRTLFDGVPVGLYRSTPTGQIVDVNLAMVQMLGYPDRESLLVVNAADLYVNPQDRTRWQALMKQQGLVRDFQIQFRRYDGETIWVNNTSRAVREEADGGQPTEHVLAYEGSVEDITERKRAEDELHKYQERLEELVKERTAKVAESEERFRAIYEGSNDAIMLLTPEGFFDCNARTLEMFGFQSKEEFTSVHPADISPPFQPDGQDSWSAAQERIQTAYQQGYNRFEWVHRRTNGKDFAAEVLLSAFALGSETVLQATVRDITERKQAEEALRRAKEEADEARIAAEAANRAKSTFLANMSHELRTPLNAILGFSELMTHDPSLSREQQENLATIGRSGEHLLALINDVLELAKIESGRVDLHPEEFDLYHLLLGVEEMFRLRAEQKGLTLVFERAPDVPQYVRADQNRLRQVLINLLGNAVKFTQEGGITLRVASSELRASNKELLTEPSTPSAHHLYFEVEDTGPGIAPEEIDKLFETFVQAQAGQQAQEGTGLGLPISRQFVQLMGGEMTVSSQVGHGTTFKFDIQVDVVSAAAVQSKRPARRVIGLEPDQPHYRLLIADDRDTNRQLLIKLLRPLGFEMREARNGQEAVEIWEEWSPHLIWMDMRMPVMDGYEATQRIKTTTKGQATAIIALTASALEEERAVVLSNGCDDFVRKPFREADIFEAMHRHLGVRYIYDELQASEKTPASEEVLTPAALAGLGADLLERLHQATISLDMELILSLIDRIRRQDPTLADALADLANNYEYKRLSTLIAEALSA